MQRQTLETSGTRVPARTGLGWGGDEICPPCPPPGPHHLLALWLQILLASLSSLLLLSRCLWLGTALYLGQQGN